MFYGLWTFYGSRHSGCFTIGGEQTIALHIIANTRDSPLNLFKPI